MIHDLLPMTWPATRYTMTVMCSCGWSREISEVSLDKCKEAGRHAYERHVKYRERMDSETIQR